MTLKEVRELLKSGKPIQFKNDETWVIVNEDYIVNFVNASSRYRLAPEPKLRPWKPEEAVGKIVRVKSNKDHCWIIAVASGNSYKAVAANGFISNMTPEWYLDNCECLDSSPCGVMEGGQ